LNTKTTTAEKKQNKTTTFEREEKMTKEKSKSVAIFFVPVGSHYWIYLRLFAMLSNGKKGFVKRI